MRRIAAILGFVALSFMLTPGALATQGEPHKVTLCHRTHSETNPYVTITVDVASVKFEGHDSHNGPIWYPGAKVDGVRWGDIIPAFSTQDGYPFDYAGKNVPEGQAWLDNDCKEPTTPTPSPSDSSTPPPSSSSPPTSTSTPSSTATQSLNTSSHSTPDSTQDPTPTSTANTGNSTAPLKILGVMTLLGLSATILARRKSA